MKKADITVINFKDNQIVDYSLLILKGRVNGAEPGSPEKPGIVRLSSDDIDLSSSIYDNNKFKFLLDLNLGNNVITLQHYTKTTSINLEYRPRISDNTVIPLYVICDGHNGEFQAPADEDNSVESALKRITVGAKLLQSLIAEKMYEINLERRTFKLELPCCVFHSKLNYETARKMEQVELWKTLGREIMSSSLGSLKKKYLAFLSCTRYFGEKYREDMVVHEDHVKITEGYVALGGGGLALFGTACLYTWPQSIEQVIPCFENDSLVNRKLFMDDSCYRGTLGGCFSTTLGSVLHELCHTFDLGHTPNGIMGRGFDNIYKVFTQNVSISSKELGPLSKVLNSSMEFTERLTASNTNTNIERQESLMKKPVPDGEPDNTDWTKHCQMFLYYHIWFNDYANMTRSCSLRYDNEMHLVSSTCGLRIIEIRRVHDEMVLHSWMFLTRVLKYSFRIPDETWNRIGEINCMIAIEDNSGHILKSLLRK